MKAYIAMLILLNCAPQFHSILPYSLLQVIAAAMALVGNERQVYETVNDLRLHLKNFKGISRRFEIIGSIGGCHIVDDYAHHPTEIRAVLQAARQRFPSKALWVVFQPHTYRYSLKLSRYFRLT